MSGGERLPVRELAELALLTALVAGGKEAMNALPNIHPVTLLLLLVPTVLSGPSVAGWCHSRASKVKWPPRLGEASRLWLVRTWLCLSTLRVAGAQT